MLSSSGLVLLDPANGKTRLRLRMEDRAVPSGAAARRWEAIHSFAHRHEHGHARATPQEEQWPIRRGRTLDLPSAQADFVDLVTYHGHAYGQRRRYSNVHRLANRRAQMERRPLRQRPDPVSWKIPDCCSFCQNRDKSSLSPPIQANTASSLPSRRWKARPGTSGARRRPFIRP